MRLHPPTLPVKSTRWNRALSIVSQCGASCTSARHTVMFVLSDCAVTG